MAAVWQVRLMDTAGDLVAVLDDYEGFSLSRHVNTAGSYAFRMDGNSDKCALFDLDGMVEFWRRDEAYGIDWYCEFGAFHRTGVYYMTADDRIKYQSEGRGYADLLARRIVADASGSAEAAKSGPAETVAKEYVDEQCGPSAGARAMTGLSIEADGADGNTVTLGRAYRNVLEVVQEIASIGGGDFAVIRTAAATFEFRWYDGQLGTDRTATVVFALGRGNMAQPDLRLSRASEVNAVLVGGQGEGAARATEWRTDAVRIADSTWNRQELFFNASNEPLAAGLQAKGDALLEQGRPKNSLRFEVLQVPGCLYGQDYFLGDLVTARFLDIQATKKVQSVSFDVDSAGEKCKVEMADVG